MADHPLMQGVERLKGSAAAVLDADPDTVLLNREGGPTIAVVDNIVVTSDSDVIMDFVYLNGIPECALLESENLQFIRNLYQVDLSPSPPGGGESGGGDSTGGGAGTETGDSPEDTATSTGGDGTESGDVEGSTGDAVSGGTSGSVDPGEDTDGARATADGSGRGCRAGGETPPYLAALGLLVAMGWRRRGDATC